MKLVKNATPVLALWIVCFSLAIRAADVKRASAVMPAEQPEFHLGPGDQIDVFVWKEPELSTNVVIRPDGRISLPLTGEIEASGKTAIQLQQEIRDKLRQFITEPVVNVIVKQVNSLKISVLGQVRRPDVYRIQNRVTVMDAIAMAGGFTDYAKRNKVIVLRNTREGQQRIIFDVRHAVASGSEQLYLQPQDTVYVE